MRAVLNQSYNTVFLKHLSLCVCMFSPWANTIRQISLSGSWHRFYKALYRRDEHHYSKIKDILSLSASLWWRTMANASYTIPSVFNRALRRPEHILTSFSYSSWTESTYIFFIFHSFIQVFPSACHLSVYREIETNKH